MNSHAERIKEIFGQAQQIKSKAQRERYLTDACRGNVELRQQIDSLLIAHKEAGHFLEQTIQLPSADFEPEPVGSVIGRYKLLEKIGEGGFGVVYMAEQQQPVQRKVALKIIKAGMDTREVIARFEAERQALALMDHPNIAKVLDGGTTEAKRPYFVMELVRGIPITEYCDQAKLPTTERLHLFIRVCQAVQHAHQKAVIHRDLKPSNILVTLHDGEAVPKVIDFGVAKALGQKLTEKTLFTAFRQMIGTPAYMAPEQAEMSGLDIDTRSDIYSLGVLLYELLTGVTPFDKEALARAGLDEIRRMIRETEPPKPSTRLRTLGDKLTDVAKQRHTDPTSLSRLMRGDLDWIVMKCLEKDRQRRYETANGLAKDIQRHLQSEAVTASPPSNIYRFQKLVRRHKLVFAAGSAVAAALLVGFGISTWMFYEENLARKRAVAAERMQGQLRQQAQLAEKAARIETSKSQQVAKLLEKMLHGVGPSAALGRDTTMLREILDQTAKGIGNDLTNQPEVEIKLRSILASTYHELELYKQMEVMAREGLRLGRSLAEENASVAQSLDQLGDALMHLGNLEPAEEFAHKALTMKQKLLERKDASVTEESVANSIAHVALVLERQGKLGEAEAMARKSLEIRRRLSTGEFGSVAQALDYLSRVLRSAGKLGEAEAAARDALAKYRLAFGNDSPNVAMTLVDLAACLRDEGNLPEAESLYREALGIKKKLLGNQSPQLVPLFNMLAEVLRKQGNEAQAQAVEAEALAIRAGVLGGADPTDAHSLHERAFALKNQGRLLEAEPLYREALTKFRQKNDENGVAVSLNNLAELLKAQGKLAEAEPLYAEALSIYKARNDSNGVAMSLNNIAQMLQDEGRLAEAEPMLRESLAMYRRRKDQNGIAMSLHNLGGVLRDENKLLEAEVLLRESLNLYLKRSDLKGIKISLNRLMDILKREGKSEEAKQFAKELDTPGLQTLLKKESDSAAARARALDGTQRGRWRDAATNFAAAIELNPNEHWNWFQLAPLLANEGDLTRYSEHCRAMLARFDQPQDPLVAERTAKACLLLVLPEPELAAAGKLADMAIKAATDDHWVQFTVELKEYRLARFASAVEWAQKALADPGEKPKRDVGAYAVLAMAYHQLGCLEDARLALANANETVRMKLPNVQDGNPGADFQDWFIAQILLREAQMLINGSLEKPG